MLLLYPEKVSQIQNISLEAWQQNYTTLIASKANMPPIVISEQAKQALKEEYEQFISGNFYFFNAFYLPIGLHYDWLTHPITKVKFDTNTHWSAIPDMHPTKGDIKYIWEKSRFTFVQMLIRYDHHFGIAQDQLIFDQIEDWIHKNPNNYGPNYKCSQEISLRLFNWYFALNYYQNSSVLSYELFNKIIKSIYAQLLHVQKNINFSRIAVRNNHAITECLALYAFGKLMPWLPGSETRAHIGKKYFEQEVQYQIYPDGGFLQYSHNYHRVALQLFTLAHTLANKCGDSLQEQTLQRFKATAHFLWAHHDAHSGKLPNYGANDGALFFKWNSEPFSVFTPQINAALVAFEQKYISQLADHQEDAIWWGLAKTNTIAQKSDTQLFLPSGFFVHHKPNQLLSIHCSAYKDRPQQADNLHLDWWVDGLNILRDNGSFQYNTNKEFIKYFSGTLSHNTLMLNGQDQMLKGGRFIWFFWPQKAESSYQELPDKIIYSAKVNVFRHLHKNIFHHRKVSIYKQQTRLEIEDSLITPPNFNIQQCAIHWHLHPDFYKMGYSLDCVDHQGYDLPTQNHLGWHSSHYGLKEESNYLSIQNKKAYFFTLIQKTS